MPTSCMAFLAEPLKYITIISMNQNMFNLCLNYLCIVVKVITIIIKIIELFIARRQLYQSVQSCGA